MNGMIPDGLSQIMENRSEVEEEEKLADLEKYDPLAQVLPLQQPIEKGLQLEPKLAVQSSHGPDITYHSSRQSEIRLKETNRAMSMVESSICQDPEADIVSPVPQEIKVTRMTLGNAQPINVHRLPSNEEHGRNEAYGLD